MTGPLAGLRVLEVASYVTGPYACALLADMGAQVVKVEPVEQGDPFRGWGKGGYSPTFRSVNRGKRSLAVDLRSVAGRDIVLELAARTDVLVENHRPGTVDRLGIGYGDVRPRNGRIVYCSISGFGSSGPYRDRPGYDTVGQAVSGLLSLLTDLDRPRPMGISLSDHLTGLYACYGILAALVGRSVDGEGRLVETSLLQATTAFLAENAARFFAEGDVPTRETRAEIAQAYAFVCGDGLPFAIHLSSPPKFWEGLTEAIGRPDLRDDDRFVDRAARVRHYRELEEILAQAFATGPRSEWLDRLDRHDVPAGPINRLDEVFADPGVRHLGLTQDVVHPTAGVMTLLGAGVSVAGHDDASIAPPPLLGEHTEEILGEIGITGAEVQRLADGGIIRRPAPVAEGAT